MTYNEGDDLEIYFGVGCFWHVQHEVAMAEKEFLGRDKNSYTAVAGYAGGTKLVKSPLNKNGLACYSKYGGAYYGTLGHTEVVGVKIPADKFEKFAELFAKLFDRNGERPDKGDIGPEYRHAVGIPGGFNNKKLMDILNAKTKGKLTLKKGQGNDPDNLYTSSAWVYDTAEYPFHQGEVYH